MTQQELGSGLDPPRSRRWVSRLEAGDQTVQITASDLLCLIELGVNVGEFLAVERKKRSRIA